MTTYYICIFFFRSWASQNLKPFLCLPLLSVERLLEERQQLDLPNRQWRVCRECFKMSQKIPNGSLPRNPLPPKVSPQLSLHPQTSLVSCSLDLPGTLTHPFSCLLLSFLYLIAWFHFNPFITIDCAFFFFLFLRNWYWGLAKWSGFRTLFKKIATSLGFFL